MAALQAKGKYSLRSLHEEISLYDRKLAHLLKYDQFASEQERETAAGKLRSKREVLVRSARQLVEEGVEYKLSELPRSLRTPGQLDGGEPIQIVKESVPINTLTKPRRVAKSTSPSIALDFREDVEAYVKK